MNTTGLIPPEITPRSDIPSPTITDRYQRAMYSFRRFARVAQHGRNAFTKQLEASADAQVYELEKLLEKEYGIEPFKAPRVGDVEKLESAISVHGIYMITGLARARSSKHELITLEQMPRPMDLLYVGADPIQFDDLEDVFFAGHSLEATGPNGQPGPLVFVPFFEIEFAPYQEG